MGEMTDRQVDFFRKEWQSATRERISSEEVIRKLKTKENASRAISKINEIRQRWGVETKEKLTTAQTSKEKSAVAFRSAMRTLDDEERKEVWGENE